MKLCNIFTWLLLITARSSENELSLLPDLRTENFTRNHGQPDQSDSEHDGISRGGSVQESHLTMEKVNESKTVQRASDLSMPTAKMTVQSPTPQTPDNLASCQQKCGLIQDMPCSCDVKCLIHKNCCEKIHIDCPDVITESHALFGHMIGVRVECPRENVFVINGCPGSSVTTGHPPQRDVSVAPSNNHSLISVLNEQSPEMNKEELTGTTTLLEILNMAYVSDTSTGFVYKNMNMYECNAKAGSNPVKWDMEFGTELILVPKSFSQHLAFPKSVYNLPPHNLSYNNSAGGAPCIWFSEGSCSSEHLQNNSELRDKCEAFISYVATRKNDKARTVYNNKYCVMCSLSWNSSMPMIPLDAPKEGLKSDLMFSVTVSVSSETLTMYTTQTRPIGLMPWQSATCLRSHYNFTETLSHDFSCKVQACSNDFVMRPDGICKRLHKWLFAVSDDGYALLPQEFDALPNFMQCYLSTSTNFDIGDQQRPTFTRFDRRLGIPLYVVSGTGYSPYGDFMVPTSPKDFISKLALASKLFQTYRMSRQDSFTNHSANRGKQSDATEITSLDYNRQYLIQSDPETNQERNITTTCFCSIIMFEEIIKSDDEACKLACHQDFADEDDIESVANLSTSACLSVFENIKNLGSVISTAARQWALPLLITFLNVQVLYQ